MGNNYANLLKQVRQSIKEKRRGKIRRGIMLHQDNAPVHTSRVAMDAVRECGYELLPHPPYSPDLAPSDFHLFPRLKNTFGAGDLMMMVSWLLLWRGG